MAYYGGRGRGSYGGRSGGYGRRGGGGGGNFRGGGGRGRSKGTAIFLTGMFNTRNRGMYVGTVEGESLDNLEELLEKVRNGGGAITMFLWDNDRDRGDDDRGPRFNLKADLKDEGRQSRRRPIDDEDNDRRGGPDDDDDREDRGRGRDRDDDRPRSSSRDREDDRLRRREDRESSGGQSIERDDREPARKGYDDSPF